MDLALFICQNQHMNSHIKIKYLKFDIFHDYKHWNTFTETCLQWIPAYRYMKVSFIPQIFISEFQLILMKYR